MKKHRKLEHLRLHNEVRKHLEIEDAHSNSFSYYKLNISLTNPGEPELFLIYFIYDHLTEEIRNKFSWYLMEELDLLVKKVDNKEELTHEDKIYIGGHLYHLLYFYVKTAPNTILRNMFYTQMKTEWADFITNKMLVEFNDYNQTSMTLFDISTEPLNLDVKEKLNKRKEYLSKFDVLTSEENMNRLCDLDEPLYNAFHLSRKIDFYQVLK